MRLVVDLQSAQSASRFRGIGRYSLSLTSAIIRNAGDHEIWLALNGAFPESVLSIRKHFEGLIPQDQIRVFEPPLPVAEVDSSNQFRMRAAEKIREHFLWQLKPDLVYISSLFEGYEDDAVTSIGAFSSGLPTAVTLFDLIPLLNQQKYLRNETHREYYLRKIQYLKRANILLAISESSRSEAVEALHMPPDRVVNVSAAAGHFFAPVALKPEKIQELRTRYGIQRKVVMYAPGGYDSRKNCDGLIRAYASLPAKMRAEYQLVVSSKIDRETYGNIQELRKQVGLGKSELVLTGYMPDEDLVALYNFATLSVFPSKHEGFGLPALEAMACGTPTIGANTTSIPEVIGWEQALFDPNSIQSIASKMEQALRDDVFREQLRQHGLQQSKKFSWDESAKRAWVAFEGFLKRRQLPAPRPASLVTKPKLAYISPLPPERSGISDYSSELLPELAKYYDIDVIVHQRGVSDPWVQKNCGTYSVEWFQTNASKYQRILYQFGNSPFHTHMFELLHRFPGVIVLHDFFLSAVLAHDEINGFRPGAWTRALYHSHGYAALAKSRIDGATAAIAEYPCNLQVLQDAKGVIVHSEYSKKLAQIWYADRPVENWSVIPLLRTAVGEKNRATARSKLEIPEDAFVICSLGFIDPSKCNHRLLAAWCASKLASDIKCILIFVGENHGGEYGQRLLQQIQVSGLQNRIRITGWTDRETFENYLAAGDMGVQLRTLSRGETSAAALDCMNYGLATVVNANGSMVDIPEGSVCKIPDVFSDRDLVEALERLYENGDQRREMARRAQEVIGTRHNPAACAHQYFDSIETFYQRPGTEKQLLLKSITNLDKSLYSPMSLKNLAHSIAASSQPELYQRQIFIDVSSIVQTDLKTGIERVVRSQLLALINDSPVGFRIEPVYLTNQGGQWHYRYAGAYTCQILGIESVNLRDVPIDVGHGDIFYGLDFAPSGVVAAAKAGIYLKWKALGVQIVFLVYDLLPILRPEFFPVGSDSQHRSWLKTIGECSSCLICISNSVATELRNWLRQNMPTVLPSLKIEAVHLGADIKASLPTLGLGTEALETIEKIKSAPSFLMVGTIEPRKGHSQVLAAFEKLWKSGHQVNLVIVGGEGWKHLPESQRRGLPQLIKRLRQHVELGNRLFWLKGVSDEYLEKIYNAGTCLIAASEAEGFGLPLIEAAQQELPIIARDIPVFREVAESNAYYFSGLTAHNLAEAVSSWLILNSKGQAPMSTKMQWSTWKQVAKKVVILLTQKNQELSPKKRQIRQKAMDEHLNLIHGARLSMVKTLLPSADCILDLGGANCPLYKMGYPYQFKKLTLIDLPPDLRHEYYKDIEVDSHCSLGPVFVRYTDMTTLEGISDESVDFVWSGQSIEHVPLEAGIRMCREAFRVLKKGGSFCLDTPNRRLTEIHTASAGGGFIHPEHYIEYHPEHLMQILKDAGFSIKNSMGICEMPETLATGIFHYEDFLFGKQITERVADGYIQFHHCVKL